MFPTDKVIEFKKLTIFNKVISKKVSIEQLKRVGRTALTPFRALKDKKTNEDFSMYSVANWHDYTLFNTLFPRPKKEISRKERTKKL